MDESLVDIVLILLAALVAVAVIPTFEIELPTSMEVNDSEVQLKPLQIAIDPSGEFLYAGGSDNTVVSVSAQGLYDLVYDTHPNRTIEFLADRLAPASILVEANRIVQEIDRNAVFLVVVGP